MALEYRKITKRGYQLRYGSIHSCKKCTYLTKSIFFMLNHVKCHKQPKDKFDCKNFPEVFSCKECDFTTNLTIRFNQHFKRIHNRKKQKEPFNCRVHKCRNCSFHTYSSLMWLKHHSNGCRKEVRNPPDSLEAPKSKKNTSESENSKPKSPVKEKNAAECSFQSRQNDNSKTESSNTSHHKPSTKPNLPKKHIWHKCSQCIFRTMSRHSLINHRKTKHQGLQDTSQCFKCTACAFVTSSENHFRVHKMKHKSSFDCNKCTEKFSNLNALIRHKIREHVDNTLKKKCEVCSFETCQC